MNMDLTTITVLGQEFTVTVSNDGKFGLTGALVPAGADGWMYSRYSTLEAAEAAAKKLAQKTRAKTPAIGLKYYDPQRMGHATVERKRVNGHYTVRQPGGEAEEVDILCYDAMQILSSQEVEQHKALKAALKQAQADLFAFEHPLKLKPSLSSQVRKREEEIEAELAKEQVEVTRTVTK